METQTPSHQKVTNDTATQTETCLQNSIETQTPYFNPSTPISPSSLSSLKESKVDDTLENSRLNESEVMDSIEGSGVKRKCISPIEAPKPEPTSPTDSNLQLSFASIHESYQGTSPTIGLNASYSQSDFAVDYHDVADYAKEFDTQEESNPEDSSSQSNDQDTDSTGGKVETHLNPCMSPGVGTPCILQAYFFSKELAQKMNATEIKETILKEEGEDYGNFICSVLQLNKPHGSHYLYIHTVLGCIKLPTDVNIGDIEVTLEEPRKRIARICDCKKISRILMDEPDPE